jgi:hypothetical protein
MTSEPVLHYGNAGASSDSFFLINGSAPHGITIIGDRDNLSRFSEFTNSFAMVTVFGRPDGDHLVIDRVASHAAIARRAFAILESVAGGTAERHWLRAEQELLGLRD